MRLKIKSISVFLPSFGLIFNNPYVVNCQDNPVRRQDKNVVDFQPQPPPAFYVEIYGTLYCFIYLCDTFQFRRATNYIQLLILFNHHSFKFFVNGDLNTSKLVQLFK